MNILETEFKFSGITRDEFTILTKGVSALASEVKEFEKENGVNSYSKDTEKYLKEIKYLHKQLMEFF